MLRELYQWVRAALQYLLQQTRTPQGRVYSTALNCGRTYPSSLTPLESIVLMEAAGDGGPVVDSDSTGKTLSMLDLHVEDITQTAYDGKYKVLIKPDKVVVHRIGPELDCRVKDCTYCGGAESKENKEHSWALHMCRWFQSHPKLSRTGGENPYHFVVDYANTHQTLHLDECGAHARRWNVKSIAIAVRGDFRYNYPNEYQKKTVKELSLLLCLYMNKVDLWGHTELHNATKDLGKSCPGTFMRMEQVRQYVRDEFKPLREELGGDAVDGLLGWHGIVLP